MSEIEGERSGFQYRRSVREHAHEPLEEAREYLDHERAEVRAERAAFERFAEKVGGIRPAPTTAGPLALSGDDGAEKRAAVRELYEETVLDLDHYEDVYGEPLLVNVASELSADIAEGLRKEGGVPFSAQFRDVVRAAATDAAERRGEFLDRLADERDSIENASEAIREMTDALGASGLPPGQRHDFEDRLDGLVRRRQQRLQSRAAYRQDGHDLCEYVYADAQWTYPVLTAVTRLRNSVD